MHRTMMPGGFRALSALAILSCGAIAAAVPAASAAADDSDRGRGGGRQSERDRGRDRGSDRHWDRGHDHGRDDARRDHRRGPSYAEIEFARGQRDGLRAGYDRGYADGLGGRDLRCECDTHFDRESPHFRAGFRAGFEDGYRAGYLAGKRECERLRELERQRERERRDRCDPPRRGGFRIIDGFRIDWHIRL